MFVIFFFFSINSGKGGMFYWIFLLVDLCINIYCYMLLTVKYSKVFYLKFSFLLFRYILVKITCFPVDKDPIKDIFLEVHLFLKSLGDEIKICPK